MTTTDRPTHVVIVGAGFGGLAAARALRRAPVQITIVDRSNHHLFQPLLYQVATAALSPADIAAPIRRIFRHQANVAVMLADASAVDVSTKRVVLADGSIDYDILIVATGVTHAYFGHDDWAKHAPGLKSLHDALLIRRRVLISFEVAERERDEARRRAWMTFVIVGAGPTGVELAGTLAEVTRQTLAKDFRRINTASARVILVEASPRVLGAYTEDLSAAARKQLERLGVTVWTGVQVTGIDAEGIWIGPERIHTRTVLWAAGVAASPLAQTLGVPLDRAGRVLVKPDLTVPGLDDVYVIGDLAHLETDGVLVPGVAPAAMQQGWHVAQNIIRTMKDQPRLPFRYVDKGMLATIGRGAAVAKIGPIKASGLFAWLLWLFVHILFLIGFRNRLLVMIQWACSYVTFDRGTRLITEPLKQPLVESDADLSEDRWRTPEAS
ncbi:MAG TPA: NAD(P)/FAD-dependent oxidoreductase [Isosphaeraceae bacterium]|nr:NAD(P)/FAD-dependent oxidoreductase [Isosphaeraceae bacterium]